MAERVPDDPDAGDRIVRLDDGDMHVVQDGQRDALCLVPASNCCPGWDTPR
jgi:hypothetical protein